MRYDIIGDIHGHASELECLLAKLGYPADGTSHPQRNRLIFLGDFIDRGPENRRTIEIVRALVTNGVADAVMGNHEYNAICFHTPSKTRKNLFLREHSPKNIRQHQAFLDDYPDTDERGEVIRWFQTLPLFLEFDDLRIVHACWEPNSIQFMRQHYGDKLSHEFLFLSSVVGSKEHQAIELLLKGPERQLRNGLSFYDKDGNERLNFRLQWWQQRLDTLRDAAVLPAGALSEYLDTPLCMHPGGNTILPYPTDAAAVIFGHYSMSSNTESRTHNTACMDWDITSGNKLAALRWESNSRLSLAQMETVTVEHGEHLPYDEDEEKIEVEFAEDAEIERYDEIATEFIKKIFDLEKHQYFISDRTNLYDFAGCYDVSNDEIVRLTLKHFDTDISDMDLRDINSPNLLAILKRICVRKKYTETPT